MEHCPVCGARASDGPRCPACGAALPTTREANRTLLGGVGKAQAALAEKAAATGPAPARTILGMPATAVGRPAAPASGSPNSSPARTILGMPQIDLPGRRGRDPRTTTDVIGSHIDPAEPPPMAAHAPPEPGSAQRTLLGVARPGIAPIAPGVAKAPAPKPAAARGEPGGGRDASDVEERYQPAEELGATVGFPMHQKDRRKLAGRMRIVDPVRAKHRDRINAAAPPKSSSRRALIVVGAAGVLALAAVLVALLWPSAPPLVAKAMIDGDGREIIEIRCGSCPDGTRIQALGGEAKADGGVARILPTTPLVVGENPLRVQIDRPGNGRDETLNATVHVAYRAKADLSTLEGQKPSIQIVVEAIPGSTVELDGQSIALVGGKAIQTIDIAEQITGPATELTTIKRTVKYKVTPPEGEAQAGEVTAAIGVVPLVIDAPGPRVAIDTENFTLAGRTLKGAEVVVAGRPLPVKPDGSFEQLMNVSRVGATQIEVRANMPDRAPRLFRIAVSRVDDLKTAAAEFKSRSPVGWTEIGADPKAHVGKPVVVTGEIVEARRLGFQTAYLLHVPKDHGCTQSTSERCEVRLVQGQVDRAKRGDFVTAYGYVAGLYSPKEGSSVPEIDVEFLIATPKATP